jgi:hypothetical protein
MANMTERLHSGLRKVFLHGIGSSVVYGVRYVLADSFDRKRKTGVFEELKAVYTEAANVGFGEGEICSALGVGDGVALVLAVPAVKQLMLEVAQASGVQGWDVQVQDGWAALDVALANAKGRLAEHVIQQVRNSKYEFDVTLYSGSVRPTVQFMALTPNKERVKLVLPSFTLSHTDIVSVNDAYLIPRGYRIVKLTPRDFVPGKGGIISTLACEKLNAANWF